MNRRLDWTVHAHTATTATKTRSHNQSNIKPRGPKRAQVDAANVRPADWERLRAGIALKTFTALIKQYKNMGEKEEAKRLREARRFAKGLFWNVKGEPGRDHVTREDFDAFFEDRDIADQVGGWGLGMRVGGGTGACSNWTGAVEDVERAAVRTKHQKPNGPTNRPTNESINQQGIRLL
jgi:hypothetical protein